jgi:hypothetical protein
VFGKFSRLAIGVAFSVFAVTASANAAVITQTIDFSIGGFAPILGTDTAPFDPVTGTFVITWDTATSVSLSAAAVGSASFSSPFGFFPDDRPVVRSARRRGCRFPDL